MERAQLRRCAIAQWTSESEVTSLHVSAHARPGMLDADARCMRSAELQCSHVHRTLAVTIAAGTRVRRAAARRAVTHNNMFI